MRGLWLAVVAACSGPKTQTATPPNPGSGTVTAPLDAPEASQDERLAAIQKAMNELDEAAQHCWALAATERFDIEGDVEVMVDISATGAKTQVMRDTTRNSKLLACVSDLLGKYKWAPPLHGQAIQLPFKFRSPGGQNTIDRNLVPWNGQGKVSVAVLLDENNTANAQVSMVEIALQAGGSTGMRVAERAELWYFLGPATVNKKPVAAGDMMFVPMQVARDVAAPNADVHAVIVLAPGGREGSARAGALPTRELGGVQSAGGPVMLPAAKAKKYGPVTLIAEAATTKSPLVAGGIIELANGATVPEHVHEKETELVYVLSGSGTMTVGGVKLAVTPTSVVQIPPKTKHAFTATADVRAVQFYAPAGPEQRFKANTK
ncbi:MAG: cupin domain-containing protein [Myxococcota bacterium]|nr:cupin domain-containing protein [Deltaproteobacteria bacterium]MDQ3334308.1 cupin domain-containing protein [Myxococcota bacterium]